MRRKARGVHFGEVAAQWALTRFPSHLQSSAAYVADLLFEQLGVKISELEPSTSFTVDLRMDALEPVEVVLALEQDLEIAIPDEDWTGLNTFADLVLYLHARISAHER